MTTRTTPIPTRRPAEERGRSDHGWLQARFTFSFADYFDPDHMGFKSLRVMNNDTIQPGGGFPAHPHANMEIFTYVVEGRLEHKDSMGNGSVIEAGDLQYMSAGAGVRHSEFNPSNRDRTVLYQIWLTPKVPAGEPRYAEKPLRDQVKPNELHLLFSGSGEGGSTMIRQDADIYFSKLEGAREVTIPASAERPHVWVQVINGRLRIGTESLEAGDGLALEHAAGELAITADADSKLLVFRLT